MFHVKQKSMSEELVQCPICDSDTFHRYMEVTDWFLTKERFLLVKCSNCGLIFINPRPDITEISPYYCSDDYISHGLKNTKLIDKIYGFIRQRSIRMKFNLIRPHMSGLNILDIGCGTGEFLSYCQIKGMTVRGVEPNERGRAFAIKNNLTVSDHLNFVDINPGSIDAITMWHVIEHIHDLRGTLLKINEYLNSMGVLIIAVPNSNSFDAEFFKEHWAAYDVPRHIYHFSKQNITHLAESFGFKVIKVVPQKFDAYYVSMLSLKYKYNKILSWLFPLFGLWFNIRSYYDKNRYSSLIFILKKKNN